MAKHHDIINQLIALGLETDIEKQALENLILKQRISLLESLNDRYIETEQNILRQCNAIIASEDVEYVIRVLQEVEPTAKVDAAIQKQAILAVILKRIKLILS